VHTVSPHLAVASYSAARVACCAPVATGHRLAAEAAGVAILVAVVGVAALVVAIVLAVRFVMKTLEAFAPVAHAAMIILAVVLTVGLALAVLIRP
jgi:hypothetical protein